MKGEQYAVGEGVRAARGAALMMFDLNRHKAEVDQRVEAARDRLENVDVCALRAELEAALEEQADIEVQLAKLHDSNNLDDGGPKTR